MMLYLSGPMTGLPEFNIPAFTAAAEALRSQGHTVIVPHEVCPHPPSWDFAMRPTLTAMLNPECKAIVQLPEWQLSRGACLEHYVALKLGYKIFKFVDGELQESVVARPPAPSRY